MNKQSNGHNQGIANPNARLTPDAVRKIRASHNPRAGITRRVLADRYKVGIYAIRDVLEGRTWSDID